MKQMSRESSTFPNPEMLPYLPSMSLLIVSSILKTQSAIHLAGHKMAPTFHSMVARHQLLYWD